MKHQWEKTVKTPGGVGVYVYCANGCGVTIGPLTDETHFTIDAMALTSECLAGINAEPVELLSTEPLTRITEDLWVNPALVASVTVWRGPEYKELGDTGSIIARMIDDPQATTIVLSGGKTYHVPLPLHEVVALLNGSA